VAPERAGAVATAARAAGVGALRLGSAGEDRLMLAVGEHRLEAGVADLAAAWERSL
jgi:hypothetical protein